MSKKCKNACTCGRRKDLERKNSKRISVNLLVFKTLALWEGSGVLRLQHYSVLCGYHSASEPELVELRFCSSTRFAPFVVHFGTRFSFWLLATVRNSIEQCSYSNIYCSVQLELPEVEPSQTRPLSFMTWTKILTKGRWKIRKRVRELTKTQG